jgi:SAM-dependent methyltransferase
MKQTILPLVTGLLVSFGCGALPGQDVRFEPTPMPVVRALLELAEVGPQDLVYDLGSGDGRILIAAASEFGARGVGIEIDPALVTQAQAKAREAGVEDKVTFRLGDMYVADVRPATVVTLFLHPGPNLKLREKLRSDLQAGSRVVSYVRDMGSWRPSDVRQVNEHRIFLWRIPFRAGLITGQHRVARYFRANR